MRLDLRHVLGAGILLWLFAVIGTAVVAVTHDLTAERIAENRRLTLLRKLQAVVPPTAYDNDLLDTTREVPPAERLGTREPTTAYLARREGEPVAVVLRAVAPDGYNGRIALLVGIYRDGRIAGVRVVEHRETPGLGDGIEEQRSDWIERFEGKSLGDPPRERWAVQRDGGAFDALTGATITSRAVVEAVKEALLYFEAHRERLLAQAEEGDGDGG